MKGLRLSVGAPAHISWRGEIRPVRLTLAMLGEMESWLLSKLESPYSILASCDIEVSGELLEVADREFLSMEPAFSDIDEFLDTREGCSFALWLNFRERGESLESIYSEMAILPKESVDKIISALRFAGGWDRHASLDWPDQGDTSGGRFRVDWRLTFNAAFEAGILPNEVGDLTLYQYRVCFSSGDVLRGKKKIPASEWIGMSPSQRRKMLDGLRSKRERFS